MATFALADKAAKDNEEQPESMVINSGGKNMTGISAILEKLNSLVIRPHVKEPE